uniref:Uncharacterized protein n=1 Tax=Cacopsylla melanoneura TaxID=428564 RepID=A0A8D8XE08_9HEMI
MIPPVPLSSRSTVYSSMFVFPSCFRNQSEYELLRIDKLYSCLDGGKPVLHDTVIQLSIERHTIPSLMHQSQDDLSCDLDDVATGYTSSERQENFQITGSVVTPLRVSLSRQQYEQLLGTIDTLFNHTTAPDSTGKYTNYWTLLTLCSTTLLLLIQLKRSPIHPPLVCLRLVWVIFKKKMAMVW